MSVTITERLCRTCMNESKSHSLIYGELSLEDSILYEVINDVCQLEVSAGDGLPEYICRDCFIKLSEFQRFKYRAHEVNLTLQRMKEKETSGIPSPEPCGSSSTLRDTWIKPDYSAEEHAENDGVSPDAVKQVEVKVEPEDSYEEDSDGREGEPFEEYIGIEPDDLAYSAVGFDGQNPADATDPLQVPESGVELKQESLSPERCHSTEKDSFVIEGLKEEENVIPEALPVEEGTCSALDATASQRGETGKGPEMQRNEEVTDLLGAVKDKGMLTPEGKSVKLASATGIPSNSETVKVSGDKCLRSSQVVEGTVIEGRSIADEVRKVVPLYRTVDCRVVLHDIRLDPNLKLLVVPRKEQHQYSKRVVRLRGESTGIVCGRTLKDMGYPEAHKRCHADKGEGPKPLSKRKRFSCDFCGHGFERKGHLAVHIRTHTGERPYRCGVCSKMYSSKNVLSLHLKIHSSEKPHVCHLCGMAFTQKNTLKLHVKRHEGPLERKFCCTVCNKKFTDKVTLVRHSRTHSDYRPFLCSICGKGFKLDCALKVHRGLVHERTERYFCEKCGKGFYLKDHLVSHIMRHGEERAFACDLCSKTFKTRNDLFCHKRTHKGLKSYACSMCTKKFTSSGNLKIHSRIHTGEKPYPCPNCGKRFTQSANVTRHLKSCVK